MLFQDGQERFRHSERLCEKGIRGADTTGLAVARSLRWRALLFQDFVY